MYRRIALVLVACLALAAAPVAALGAKKRAHKVNVTVVAGTVGVAGPTAIIAGTVSGTLKGAVVYHATPAPNNQVKNTFTAFTTKGSIKGTAVVTATPQPDGTSVFSGSGKVTGGTGAYKGAKGTFTATGNSTTDGLIHLTLKGSVKY
jgi:hypothetical protein